VKSGRVHKDEIGVICHRDEAAAERGCAGTRIVEKKTVCGCLRSGRTHRNGGAHAKQGASTHECAENSHETLSDRQIKVASDPLKSKPLAFEGRDRKMEPRIFMEEDGLTRIIISALTAGRKSRSECGVTP
jgi:hypothetical protein